MEIFLTYKYRKRIFILSQCHDWRWESTPGYLNISLNSLQFHESVYRQSQQKEDYKQILTVKIFQLFENTKAKAVLRVH